MTAKNQQPTYLYSLTHLAIIEVNGEDASRFLQGQLTCNIHELSEDKTSIAAFCNAKGRTISTLLVLKTQAGFSLILPAGLADIVMKKLQMYILRAKVSLSKPGNLIIAGLNGTGDLAGLDLPSQDFYCNNSQGFPFIKMPSPAARFLCIAPFDPAEYAPFKDLPAKPGAEWRFQDISSGLPWFAASRSEQYIPQMLDIDRLGGISFNKGCYTGQEVVARTHYLGKTKRHLYLAECGKVLPADADFAIKDAGSHQKCGDILCSESSAGITRLLAVLQTVDGNIKNLILDNQEHTAIKLIPYQ